MRRDSRSAARTATAYAPTPARHVLLHDSYPRLHDVPPSGLTAGRAWSRRTKPIAAAAALGLSWAIDDAAAPLVKAVGDDLAKLSVLEAAGLNHGAR
jgi:hypothetical protein